MIEEVVNSILEAEDVSKQKIAQAEAQASEILSNAEMQAEAERKQASLHNKATLSNGLKSADKQAEVKASEYLAQLNAVTDKEISKYTNNVDKAVKLVVEAV